MKKTNNNRIAVILGCNTHWAPYYRRYESLLNKENYAFDLIIWNREHILEDTSANIIEYNVSDKTNSGSFMKIYKFIGFAFFVKKNIRKHKYSKILFLGTVAGVPAFLCSFLSKKYYKKYWVDLRDLTYENIYAYYLLMKKVILNSYKTVISSKGFAHYLPAYNYGIIHNVDPSMEEIFELYKYKKTKSDKIRISYIGNLAYWEQCKSFISVFANDNRFLLKFIGPGSDRIEKYCFENKITNTEFYGRFERSRTVDFYAETDIIYNLYGNSTRNVRCALSNKLYYAMRFELPILVNTNTYMEKIVKKYNMGFVFEDKPDYPNKLYCEYNDFDKKKHRFLDAWKSVVVEDKKANADLLKFLQGDND